FRWAGILGCLFFFQAEDGIRDLYVTGVQTCALPISLMKDRSYGLMPDGFAWIMVRLDIHFRAELRWPGTIEMGLGVVKFGRTSVTFDQVVFSEGTCVASAQSVSVLLDEATRKPTPLTPDILANFQRWIRRGANPG